MNMKSLWTWTFLMMVGSSIGAGSYVLYFSNGIAYLSDNPRSCTQCHAMQDVYNRWEMSSHRHVATCNSCHSSGNFFEKYLGKARNGFFHSVAFTLGYKEPIQINEFNRKVTEKACRTCHSELINSSHFQSAQDNSCIHCHSQVGHLER